MSVPSGIKDTIVANVYLFAQSKGTINIENFFKMSVLYSYISSIFIDNIRIDLKDIIPLNNWENRIILNTNPIVREQIPDFIIINEENLEIEFRLTRFELRRSYSYLINLCLDQIYRLMVDLNFRFNLNQYYYYDRKCIINFLTTNEKHNDIIKSIIENDIFGNSIYHFSPPPRPSGNLEKSKFDYDRNITLLIEDIKEFNFMGIEVSFNVYIDILDEKHLEQIKSYLNAKIKNLIESHKERGIYLPETENTYF